MKKLEAHKVKGTRPRPNGRLVPELGPKPGLRQPQDHSTELRLPRCELQGLWLLCPGPAPAARRLCVGLTDSQRCSAACPWREPAGRLPAPASRTCQTTGVPVSLWQPHVRAATSLVISACRNTVSSCPRAREPSAHGGQVQGEAGAPHGVRSSDWPEGRPPDISCSWVRGPEPRGVARRP